MVMTSMKDCNVCLYPLAKVHERPVPQWEYDVNNWRDPKGNKFLRYESGLNPDVQAFVKQDRRYAALRDDILTLAEDVIDKQHHDWVSVGLRDHHGVQISLALCWAIAKDLDEAGFAVCVYTHELLKS